MRKRNGRLVKCKSGKGIIYSDEMPVNGKYQVHLTDDKFEPVKDDEGKERKILASADNIVLVGYVN